MSNTFSPPFDSGKFCVFIISVRFVLFAVNNEIDFGVSGFSTLFYVKALVNGKAALFATFVK